jgi:hypothetical protein
VRSALDKGSDFEILLPVVKDAEAAFWAVQ